MSDVAVPTNSQSTVIPWQDWAEQAIVHLTPMIEMAAEGGATLAFASMPMGSVISEFIGPTVIKQGPVIDEPIYRWTVDHQVKWWGDVMERLTKIGNSQTSWGVAGTAAAALAVTWSMSAQPFPGSAQQGARAKRFE